MPNIFSDKAVVLVLCTGNSARSQMAEAFLRKYGGDRIEVHSAGLEPKGIHPLTIQVMQEIGLSLEGHHSKSLQDFLGKLSAKYVIFVCERAEQSCPHIWPFSLSTYCMPFRDPAAAEGTKDEQLAVFREVRDEIEIKMREWLANESLS